MTTPSPAIAVIDGMLCRLNRAGTPTARHQPLATAVLEFRHGPMRLYVREHPYGLLPGVPNVYCLDPNLRLLWLAEWPLADDPCGALGDATDTELTVRSVAGVTVRLDVETGRVIASEPALAAAI